MRVIAHHGWVDGNYLESAGDLRHRCQPLRDQINRLPQRKGAGRGGEGVLDVDVTDERQLDVGGCVDTILQLLADVRLMEPDEIRTDGGGS